MPHGSKFRNRSTRPLAVALTGAFLLAGCLTPAERETQGGTGTAPAAVSREEGFRILESMGYSKDEIVSKGPDFIVEGDMVFTSEALARTRGAPLSKTAQRASTAVKIPKPNFLRVVIHSSMSDWAKYVHQAVNNWNAPNTRLRLQVVPEGGEIYIYSDASLDCPESMRDLPDTQEALGEVATNGFPGQSICVRKDASGFASLVRRVTAITHELGHTIGFHHTDQSAGVQVPGTPEFDFWSIMGSTGNTFGSLSIDDHIALEVLYNSDKPLGGTDQDGDLKDDIVYWRPSNGRWAWLQSATNFTSSSSATYGTRGDWPMADMDLDADGVNDRVFWRGDYKAVDGWWHAILSKGGVERTFKLGQGGNDIPINNHDMDGDNKDDLVTWRWSNATFYVLTSSSDYTTRLSYQWGDIGDIPVGGIDADKDGKDDFVVWRGRQRLFWVRYSASNFTTSGAYFMGGQVGDIPVGSTDLDRDSRDDLTVWRPASGNWYALTSGSGFASSLTYQLGGRGDVPIIGTDIDKDGKRDITIWRPTSGTWFFLKSSTNFSSSVSYVWGQ